MITWSMFREIIIIIIIIRAFVRRTMSASELNLRRRYQYIDTDILIYPYQHINFNSSKLHVVGFCTILHFQEIILLMHNL